MQLNTGKQFQEVIITAVNEKLVPNHQCFILPNIKKYIWNRNQNHLCIRAENMSGFSFLWGNEFVYEKTDRKALVWIYCCGCLSGIKLHVYLKDQEETIESEKEWQVLTGVWSLTQWKPIPQIVCSPIKVCAISCDSEEARETQKVLWTLPIILVKTWAKT